MSCSRTQFFLYDMIDDGVGVPGVTVFDETVGYNMTDVMFEETVLHDLTDVEVGVLNMETEVTDEDETQVQVPTPDAVPCSP